ncbi:MAG: NAD(P)/FAD-dependent oxidoreductase [Treponema sp.]|nr:NAD(P)/FAD-dependent oxidoreductase [Treponema sp.]
MICDVAVIGGGPAGLAAALASGGAGAKTLLIEREGRLGGILKQCIHDGFGVIRFGQKLSGPEYSQRDIDELGKSSVERRLLTFVSRVHREEEGFTLTLSSGEGMDRVRAKTLVLATGCRERTARQVSIHGTRPAGVITAGAAQYYTNILGRLPCRRCVILGSGDIGLIMARRLTLEGAEVIGVYEAKSTPSGLSRNIVQCLGDFNIPLHVGKTVTRVFGRKRLEAVEIASVDEAMKVLPGTEERISCDGLVLSVGLIPENELAETLGVILDGAARGPLCDQTYMTSVPGIFCCGNALLVNDLADYVSETGRAAGQNAALAALGKGAFGGPAVSGSPVAGDCLAALRADSNFLCLVPQRLNTEALEKETAVFFRTKRERGKSLVRAESEGRELFSRTYNQLRPPEMERVIIDFSSAGLKKGSEVQFTLEEKI